MSNDVLWSAKGRELLLGKASLIVGILNVTPDSFSDGGIHLDKEAAVQRALRMLEEGAAMIDIGGESTRPGYDQVEEEVEIERVVPVVKMLLEKRPDCIVSVDTTKPNVAAAVLQAGASVINDVTGFQGDSGMPEVVGQSKAGLILMYNDRLNQRKGTILDRIRESWEHSVDVALAAGIASRSIVLDPGIGFGTTRQEDLEILQGLELLRTFGFPLMLGASRKRITACPNDLPVEARLESTIATTVAGVAAGLELFRVHDVGANVRAVGLADLIFRGGRLDDEQ